MCEAQNSIQTKKLKLKLNNGYYAQTEHFYLDGISQ